MDQRGEGWIGPKCPKGIAKCLNCPKEQSDIKRDSETDRRVVGNEEQMFKKPKDGKNNAKRD